MPIRLTLYLVKTQSFYMCCTAYKSKGLPIDGPLFSKNFCFLHA
jgi:hypothetical protein